MGELDPEMATIMALRTAAVTGDIHEMRRGSLADKRVLNGRMRQLVRVDEIRLPGAEGDRPARVVAPREVVGPPILAFHGGGWAAGSLDTHLSLFGGLALAAGRAVVAPHPRQAPEHPFPAPLDDCLAFVDAFQERFGGPVDLFGDSAGANLALATALALRDRGALPIRALSLAYGCFVRRFDTASHARYGGGDFGLSTERMRLFWEFYAPRGGALADLSEADLSGLPRTLLTVAACDPLADDSAWAEDRLKAAGVPVTRTLYPGVIHGFIHHAPGFLPAEAALAEVAAHLTPA
ncbi:MAG: alpha/beta hydrolase fold domain-containing protein [Pseudomonadota bacterium]